MALMRAGEGGLMVQGKALPRLRCREQLQSRRGEVNMLAAQIEPEANPSVGRVLLVDDDVGVRKAYARLLARLGYDVQTATDGSDAIERMGHDSFDLILSDISMPKLTGTAFLRAVRARDLDVPVVLMTGAPGLESAVEAVEYGAFSYLSKPVSFDTLTNVVRRAVQMHKLARLKRQALELVGSEGRQLGDRASLDARFSSALEQLYMLYQPIVRYSERSVFAYEALLRSREPSLSGPMELLDAAERLGRLYELGRLVRRSVERSAPSAPQPALLFVNLHSADLNDPDLVSKTSPLAQIADRVVLEITERSSLHGVPDLASKVAKLRNMGFRLAVDDLGAGYAGLSSFAQLEPEFVKLDMSLVRGLDASIKKRSVVRAMAKLCNEELTIQVVSEGVETLGERDALAQEGCDLLQGYLFAKPGSDFSAPRW